MAGDVALTPRDDKYAYLKRKLMEVYGLTDDQKADRLLDLSGIGDWKPSQLCAHIQSLTVSQDVLLRRIFLRQLPEDVRVQVAALDIGSLPELARKADVIMAAKRAPSSINASTFQKPRKKPPPREQDQPTICWYHAKFGNKAKAPCAYAPPSATSGNEQAST